ncbi:unnamed protein product [Linum trigynum]|uniref:Uncharacterized protein n=1 Tax=Linum trigynum TaxID=586398 RepID=A0AAV2G6U1_9ROSI
MGSSKDNDHIVEFEDEDVKAISISNSTPTLCPKRAIQFFNSLPKVVTFGSMARTGLNLIGRLFMDNMPIPLLQRIVNNLWRCSAPVAVLEADLGLLQFLFKDESDRDSPSVSTIDNQGPRPHAYGMGAGNGRTVS